MDNEAFRALVNKRRQPSAAEKSTKEIAREAVEDEFNRKRRRGGGGRRGAGRGGHDEGYGSDSGGSSDEDAGRPPGKDAKGEDEDNVPEWKRRRREKKFKDGGGAGSEYRDRAKERREGNNADYASLEGLTQSGEVDRRRQAELSKYLGGDEEHTHLVKGLDKALAEKVRREEMGQDDVGGSNEPGDLDLLLEDAFAKKQGRPTSNGVQDWRTIQPKSELGKSMLSYLMQKEKAESGNASISGTDINPVIQKSIRRSVFAFSMDSDVRRRKDAWEVPQISVRVIGIRENDAASRKMTPLNHHMIATISKKLDEGLSRAKERSKYHLQANGKGDNGDKLASIGDGEGRSKDDAEPNEDVKSNPEATGKHTNEDDSDDDIFENVGSYVPQALALKSPKPEAPETSENPGADNDGKHGTTADENDEDHQTPTEDVNNKQTKKSIFDNLIPETAPANPTRRAHKQQHHQQQSGPPQNSTRQKRKRNIIDRDVFGGQQPTASSEYSKRRGPTSAAAEGVSLSAYGGGYGEEMDVDFGGNDDGGRRKKGRGDEEGEASGDEADGKEDSGDDEEED